MDPLTNLFQDSQCLMGLRNRCLEKIHQAAMDFYSLHEKAPNLSEIEKYDIKREALFEALRFFDAKISHSQISALPHLEQQRIVWIEQICALDSLIHAWLEKSLSALAHDIQASEKNKTLLRRFKSAPTETGLDQTL